MNNINITVREPEDYPTLPDGIYDCVITWWGLPKANKKGTGFFTSVTFDVISGDCCGRKIFEHLNLTHENKTAEKIAEKTKNSILIAAGFNVDDVITSTQKIEGRELTMQITNENGEQKRKYLKPDALKNEQPSDAKSNISDDDFDNDIPF